MMYDIEVKVSLKPGMLNPEATTIQRSLALLGYEVKGTKTKEIITFVMEADSEDDAREKLMNDIRYVALVLPGELKMEKELELLTEACREVYKKHFDEEEME